MEEKFKKLAERFDELERILQNPEITNDQRKLQALLKEYNELKETINLGSKLKEIKRALQETEDTINNEEERELKQIAEEEYQRLTAEEKEIEEKIKLALLPKDPLDQKDIIVEIRAGAGGEEAALFVADLFRMYSRYAENKKWQTQLLNTNRTGIGGFKEVIFEISGSNVFSDLKYESGVHRVQRIPETEKSGRVHTSTVTVAILPQAEEVDIVINPEDLRIDVFRSSGHGGQSVNTTDSAVRITHLPTNTVTTCQDEKSQIKNREKALKVLRARLLKKKQDEENKQRGETRKSQIGTGDRAEKIRTYNFPQDRITDHRIKKSWHEIQPILDGNLDLIISSLREEDQKRMLKLHENKSR
ncbi:MAG: peptide chain release factor 1 [Candidatus Kerfeldbacteria bacterium CG08_land_8_20_14_0_20_40_16]|uniref:Peptide chain release factor 1 n=1 Tax=Candidatus Kerfeldbacteria bacterium CG08_land_8_20_14_0_20_40_16 TaxID=2014244 RepID=A0A2H0YX11_9BACT|nr:MAG: peptide chain release factor 1 [Candidatus Kerfeldbacteria bacterium CG08_land_8_20_14_0_20_40_16]